jgi:hypothetical protein
MNGSFEDQVPSLFETMADAVDLHNATIAKGVDSDVRDALRGAIAVHPQLRKRAWERSAMIKRAADAQGRGDFKACAAILDQIVEKQGYNPDQLRDWRGRFSTAGGQPARFAGQASRRRRRRR